MRTNIWILWGFKAFQKKIYQLLKQYPEVFQGKVFKENYKENKLQGRSNMAAEVAVTNISIEH